MADQEEEELRMALRMSLHSPPEAKRSKQRENVLVDGAAEAEEVEESPEMKNRKLQRELRAAAAERRMMMAKSAGVAKVEKSEAIALAEKGRDGGKDEKLLGSDKGVKGGVTGEKMEVVRGGEEKKDLNLGEELPIEVAKQLFLMIFGNDVSREVLAQWTNQGISDPYNNSWYARGPMFSSDTETCMGLVQHEGGPCGVLAALQAFVLKYLLFCPDDLHKNTINLPSQHTGPGRLPQRARVSWGFTSFIESGKASALIQSMVEVLFLCGNKKRAVIATLRVLNHSNGDGSEDQKDAIIAQTLEGLPFESASDLQKVLRVSIHTSVSSAFQHMKEVLPIFRSRLGAMLFLISSLLSRGLEFVQADRDDPSLPLVTAPFGHASQEIVNLLLCGQAVPNVFDGNMDLGGGMFLKGIPTSVEVGQLLKCPKWPIWVVGSESHYTVIFALDTGVQDENELEERESQIRRAFDAQDQSGGGGFISVEGLQQVVKDTGISLPNDKLDQLSSIGFIVWSEFWQVLLDLDKSQGGLKDSTGRMGIKAFDLYHFNGIAKSVLNGTQPTPAGETPLQRPRLSKLRVSVPPRWTPEEFLTDGQSSSGKDNMEATPSEPPQHAPLVDCIRTRWPRAVCNWDGDAPTNPKWVVMGDYHFTPHITIHLHRSPGSSFPRPSRFSEQTPSSSLSVLQQLQRPIRRWRRRGGSEEEEAIFVADAVTKKKTQVLARRRGGTLIRHHKLSRRRRRSTISRNRTVRNA
ncbi:hypothetical protein Syun_013805 [Stephania yunnanensis]|uniref:ubiquitinyl hydrolase 1 n=1 Tax=Stephania yunnanensis TaxID=152371 RepID=A0AAP0JK72_9MAGN